MNTFSHILLGKLLWSCLKEEHGIVLHRRLFIRGNYTPDFSLELLSMPHYMKYWRGFVDAELQSLSALRPPGGPVGKELSHRLGVLCHYLSDFFCRAHCEDFQGGMAAHVDYERRLHQFLTKRQHHLRAARYLSACPGDRDSLVAALDAYQTAYRSARQTLSSDAAFSLQVCIDLMVRLLPAAAEAPAPATAGGLAS
ncbi:hypothetical protein SDC9_65848 [bioreactor metagenome]|uniref:Phospholipase C/D domain-containing protein n=1 Tax=bioreactor metagenome TaxID=1076179 RepID=A0A644XZJ4_9ZZZZ